MLTNLSISNYALIEHLDFTPGAGLSIITGETGAGKSVMLGALALLKGEKADLKVVADKSRKAVVEASFTDVDEIVTSDMAKFDPEWDGGELIIRREILPSGRSRAFVNDSPATLGFLGQLTQRLLDIHSQNSNSLLSEPLTQLRLIDSVAGNSGLLSRYEEDYKKYVSLRQKIRLSKEEAASNRQQAEKIAFSLGQLDKLKPRAGELKRIESRYEALSNSEEIREALMRGRRLLDDGESSGALAAIEDARSALADVDFTLWQDHDPEIAERLRQCVVELKDIVESVDDAISLTEYDPSSMEALSSRMNAYYAALRAFRVESDAELEQLHQELRRQWDSIDGGDGSTAHLEKEAREIATRLKVIASELSECRQRAAATLQAEIEEDARKLGLENLRFEILLSEVRLSKTGGDAVEFLASFNKNSSMAPVGEIASGGELARLMLAVKKVTASKLVLPTIIFDEIDTGVSGSIADRMGEMMMEMGRVMQILTITHLPQVAVKGARHFKVYKEDRGDKTVSDVMLLDEAQRVQEIGRMLSGECLDEAALSNARSLLKKR